MITERTTALIFGKLETRTNHVIRLTIFITQPGRKETTNGTGLMIMAFGLKVMKEKSGGIGDQTGVRIVLKMEKDSVLLN